MLSVKKTPLYPLLTRRAWRCKSGSDHSFSFLAPKLVVRSVHIGMVFSFNKEEKNQQMLWFLAVLPSIHQIGQKSYFWVTKEKSRHTMTFLKPSPADFQHLFFDNLASNSSFSDFSNCCTGTNEPVPQQLGAANWRYQQIWNSTFLSISNNICHFLVKFLVPYFCIKIKCTFLRRLLHSPLTLLTITLLNTDTLQYFCNLFPSQFLSHEKSFPLNLRHFSSCQAL